MIYPHEGLKQAEFIIDEIRKLSVFSEEAFQYGKVVRCLVAFGGLIAAFLAVLDKRNKHSDYSSF